jgi:hypothetical protein
LAKLGRKVCCKFKQDVQCIGLTNGKKLCFMEETTEEQFYEKHEMQLAFCSFFPEVEKVAFMAALKRDGFSNFRRLKN